MQSETTLGNVTITDARAQTAPPPTTEKPKERSAEEKKLWDQSKDKAFNRLFPESKKKEAKPEEKESAKTADKAKAETDKKANKDGQNERTPERPTDRPKAEKSTEDGERSEPSSKAETAPKAKAEKPEPAAEGEPTKPAKESPSPSLDYEKLAKTVAAETAKAVSEVRGKETESAKPKAEPAKPEDDIPAARRRDAEALAYLEANNPRYKGKLAEFKEFAKKEADHIAKWERDNPGLEFDPESEEHASWYDKHEPEIDPDDLIEARAELIAERKAKALIEKETGSTRQELEQIKLQRDIERAEVVVPVLARRNFESIATALGDEVTNALKELKGNETLEGRDPAAHAVLVSTISDLNAKTHAAVRIFGTNGRAYNANNAVHKAVADEAVELEANLLALPAEKRVAEDGRTYAKLDDWANMTDAQRQKHWTIDADIMAQHMTYKASKKAAELYKSQRENEQKQAEILAARYGFVKADAAQAAQTKTNETAPETEETQEKHRSPSTATRSVIQPGTKTVAKTSKDGGSVMLDKLFSR